ncbi:hypothetical protein ACFY3V_01000 [Streptosporangium sp. NPDC000095]|uniref:hypothetical protein n=1 Tax=Streptosporangium sp. NPDC000095 TaxID=3366184 RepID=UPI00368A2930
MAGNTVNSQLQAWVDASGLSLGEISRRVGALARDRGHRQIAPDTTRVRRWLNGEQPRPPVPELLAQVLSEELRRSLTPSDLGLRATALPLDTIELPLLRESAAETLVGWTRMDLLMPDRREVLNLIVGTPLVAGTAHLLETVGRPLSRRQAGFSTDTVAALEEVTAAFARLESAHGGALCRSAIVGQLAEVMRRIQDGVPDSLRIRVFATTADLAALAGWTSHDAGRYGAAQRYWSYALYAAGEAGVPGRGAEIVTRMSHQMIYLGRLHDALALLDLAAVRARRDGQVAVQALVQSQTGRVHAGLGRPGEAARHLGYADELLTQITDSPEWVAYFDDAEHAGARAVSARDLTHLGHRGHPASPHFEAALRLRKPGFDRVQTMDLIGLAAALLDESDLDRAAAAGRQALESAGLQSALVAARLNTLLSAADGHHAAEIVELRAQAADFAARASVTSQVAA